MLMCVYSYKFACIQLWYKNVFLNVWHTENMSENPYFRWYFFSILSKIYVKGQQLCVPFCDNLDFKKRNIGVNGVS